MSFTEGLPGIEVGVSDILGLLGLEQGESLSEEVARLYREADSLAVFTVKVTIALFWWAAHMGSATADALGLAAQMQAESATVNKYQLQAWQTFLSVKHPAEIRRVYIRTTKRIEVTKKVMQKASKVNLAPIKRELAALERWKKHTVTPDLRAWNTFHRNWDKTYLPAARTVIRWRKHPADFAHWAIMPLIAAAPPALRKPAAKHASTLIAAELVNTWQNDPQTVYNHVLKWLVTG